MIRERRERELRVSCPTCGASRGMFCGAVKGEFAGVQAVKSHAARKNRAAGLRK